MHLHSCDLALTLAGLLNPLLPGVRNSNPDFAGERPIVRLNQRCFQSLGHFC